MTCIDVIRVATILLILLIVPVCSKAQGSLLVIPKRVVFEGSKRIQVLTIANSGKDTMRYSVSVVELKMNENGAFEKVTESDTGQNLAGRFLRVFPRMIVLGPDESQNVKVQLINTSKMEDGEYRSHIHFKALPKQKKESEKFKKVYTTMDLTLKPMFGITIPVIIRKGQYNAKIDISDMSFEMVGDTLPVLKGRINRAGDMSVYGNLSIEHISPEGNATHVGLVKGIAVYSPNNIRNVEVALSNNVGMDYTKGLLKIVFTVSVENRPVKLFETSYSL